MFSLLFSASYPQDSRSYYLFFNYLFFNYLYRSPVCTYQRAGGSPVCTYQRAGGVSRLHVDNYLESHKPVEISDLRLLTIQEA